MRTNAGHPVWSESCDRGETWTQPVPLRRADLAMYSSITPTRDGIVLWYPNRKFFLLGRNISHAGLAEIEVPG